MQLQTLRQERLLHEGVVRARCTSALPLQYVLTAAAQPAGVAVPPGSPLHLLFGATGGSRVCCRDDFFGPLCLTVSTCHLG